jgi:superfamily II DNA or RNA helicase
VEQVHPLAMLVPAASVPLDRVSAAQRRKLRRAITEGRIVSAQALVSHLDRAGRAALLPVIAEIASETEFARLPARIDDLFTHPVADLLASVGAPALNLPSPWSTVSQLLQPPSWMRVTEDHRQAVVGALRIRARRRAEALAAEEARAAAWDRPPPRPLLALRDALIEARVALRARVRPEGEHAVPATFQLRESPLSVTIRIDTSDRPSVQPSGEREAGQLDTTIVLPDNLASHVRFEGSHRGLSDARWRLGAVDRMLDWLADPTCEPHRVLLEWLSRPTWQADLDRLDQIVGEAGAGAGAEVGPLGWRATASGGSVTFRPVLFRSGRAKPRNIAWRDVSAEMLVDPIDQRVYELLRQGPGHQNLVAAAEALIGHPRLIGPGSDGPVSVRRVPLSLAMIEGEDGAVELQLELEGEPIPLRLLVDLGHELGSSTKLRYVHLPGRPPVVQVVTVPLATVNALLGWLRTARPVPREGVAPLMARLPAVGALLPVRVDPSLRGAPIEGDLRPLLRLAWDGASLRIGVRLRPLPELPPVVPGEGLSELVTHRESGPAFVARDLGVEPEQVLATLAPLALPDDARSGWDWSLTDRERVLDLVLALGRSAGAWQLEWEGDIPTVGRLETESMRVRVSSGRDWLGVTGTATTEVGEVKLAEILRAARDGRSWTEVRPGVFVRIAEGLRAALGSVAAAEHGGRVRPIHAAALATLAEAGIEVTGSAAFQASVARIRTSVELEAPVPAGLQAQLRDYQVEGFRWLAKMASWAPGAVLADDMGLGKTVQSIALLLRRAEAEAGPALVVCPLSVTAGWEGEIARFAPDLQAVPYRGPQRAGRLEGLGASSVVVTTWDTMTRDAEALAQIPFGTVILDEAQAIKNARTARAAAARRLGGGFVLALTGTPVENRSEELWSLFEAVAPGLLGTEAQFAERFGTPITRNAPGARSALAATVRPFVLRRRKAQVARDLPERTDVVLDVHLSEGERILYDRARIEVIERVAAADRNRRTMELLRGLTKLRQLACHPRMVDPGSPVASSKIEQLRRRVGDLRAAGQQALVFSQFVTHLQLAREALEADGARVRWLTGSVAEADRRREVAAFQAGDGDVFLITLGAGGTGLNLTAATYVFHLDPWWNPAKEDQASDRAHRIGQTEPVTVYRLVSANTVEEQILSLHAEKRDLADALLHGTERAGDLDADELLALLTQAGAATAAEEAPSPVEASRRTAPPESMAQAPAAGLDLPDLVSRFSANVEAELASGQLRRATTARNYRLAAERLVAWAGPVADADALAAAAERYLAGVRSGELPSGTDKVFGSPAFKRLIALARAGSA